MPSNQQIRNSNQRAGSMLGVPIWGTGLGDLVDSSIRAISRRETLERPYVFACANPHSLAVADRDPVFKSALVDADAVVADGVGVRIAANICGRSHRSPPDLPPAPTAARPGGRDPPARRDPPQLALGRSAFHLDPRPHSATPTEGSRDSRQALVAT